MAINSQDLFENKPRWKKRHIIEEYDVWIGPDERFISIELETVMANLGFTQKSSVHRREVPPVENIKIMEYIQWWGVFTGPSYGVTFVPAKKGYKMIIYENGSDSAIGIDDGAPYNEVTGIARLKELIRK